MSNRDRDFESRVSIIPTQGQGILIEYAWTTLYRQTKDGFYSCYIPGFEMYFTTTEREKITDRARALLDSLMNYYMDELPKDNLKCLSLGLLRLGFKSKSMVAMKGLLANHVDKKTNLIGSFNTEASHMYPYMLSGQSHTQQNA